MPSTFDLHDEISGVFEEAAALPVLELHADSPEEIAAACIAPGCFSIRPDDDTRRDIRDTLQKMHNFFALDDKHPLKSQLNVANLPGKYGWTPMFGEPAYQPGTIAHMESFDCGFGNDNHWPDIAGFQESVENCRQRLAGIGAQVLQSLAIALGLPGNALQQHCDTHDLSTLRLLHYPANTRGSSAKNVGIAAHTDFECITLLLQTTPGLEIRHRNGLWIDTGESVDNIIVLLGDMLETWTNGSCVATGHRVRNTEEQRYSIVLFCAVNAGFIVKPMPQFVSPERPSAYPPIEQQGHLRAQVKRAEALRDAQS